MYNLSISRKFEPMKDKSLSESFNDVSKTEANESEVIKLHGYQLKLVNDIYGFRYIILVAPCGAGKTIIAKYIAAREHAKNREANRAHVFIVPQNHHIDSYSEKSSFTDDGYSFMDFNIPSYHRYGSGVEQKPLVVFKEYLKTKNEGKTEYIIMTHAGFCLLWKKLSKIEKNSFVKNTTFYIDECHHLAEDENTPVGVEVENDEGTQIGNIFKNIIAMKDPTCRIILMTATLFRGDSKAILSKENMKKFFVASVSFEDYFKTTGITSFNYDFVEYEGDSLKALIPLVKKHRDLKQIIVMPRTGSKGRDENTHLEYLKELYKIYGKDRVLDLIDTGSQVKNIKRLKEDPLSFDIILSCNLFVEGSDWPPAEVIHNLSFGPSLLKVRQIVGRIMRGFPGKTAIYAYSYIDKSNKRKKREIYTDRFNALVSVMIINNMLKKIKLPSLYSKKAKKGGSVPGNADLPENEEINLFKKITSFGLDLLLKCDQNPETYTDVLANALFYDTKLKQKRKNLTPDAEALQEYFKDKDTLKHFMQDKFLVLLRILRKASQEEIDEANIGLIREKGFDKIWQKEALACGEVFGTNKGLDHDSFKELREIIKSNEDELVMMDTKIKLIPQKKDPEIVTTLSKRASKIEIIPDIGTWVGVKIRGNKLVSRVICQNPLTVRCYKGATISDNFKARKGIYKFYQKENVWVHNADTENECRTKINSRSWKKDTDFGKDYIIKVTDIEYNYNLKEVFI